MPDHYRKKRQEKKKDFVTANETNVVVETLPVIQPAPSKEVCKEDLVPVLKQCFNRERELIQQVKDVLDEQWIAQKGMFSVDWNIRSRDAWR